MGQRFGAWVHDFIVIVSGPAIWLFASENVTTA